MDSFSPSTGYNLHSSTSNPPSSKTQAPPQKNAQWNPHENRIFIVTCRIVIADGHHNGKCFTKRGWDTFIRLLNSNSCHD
ncbi:Hypothetical predicted protein [Olea europaea subsp. europaea]|uniref:Uncharacterized protein n=1 Tax=Olea europaea subsp. europaea TaxID=158383 RepID=A0A8S0Q197_OLEEU|nr:Hypothetical predicted protein [Olea europaea subsp. europaea]